LGAGSSSLRAQVPRDTVADSTPPRLSPITVTAEAYSYLSDMGFYERRRANPGYFMDPLEVEKRRSRAQHVADFLSMIPNVFVRRVIVSPGGGTRGAPRLRGMVPIDRQCFVPRIFVDDIQITVRGFDRDATRDIDGAVQPEDVLAIEVYRSPAEVPAQYGGSESGCGVILIWTMKR
jgi:hypothetical protein